MDFSKAVNHMKRQVTMMGGRYVIVSSNLMTRRDGYPLANQANPKDAGVAVYFERNGKQMVFACDKWDRARDNIRAIGSTIEAIRGMDRWGASEMMERTFSAFEALEPPKSWRSTLGLCEHPTTAQISSAYRDKARKAHPDSVGSNTEMAALNAARQQALAQTGQE